ncbi:MAG TPA: HrpF/NolX family T3SS translocon protein [Acidobacteriaceae bacterium]
MAVQGTGYVGTVNYERSPQVLDQDSSSTAGGDQATPQGATPNTSQGSANTQQVLQGIVDSMGTLSQSAAAFSVAQGQASNASGQASSASGQASSASGQAPTQGGNGQMPQPNDTRPPGDTRSADQIVAGNPTLKNLGNQAHVMDNLKKQVGDWTDPKLTPDQRANAAYRASEVLNYIKSSNASDGSTRSSSVKDDGRVDGFTKSGDARHGTEAGALKDFGEQGYGALSQNHALDTTSDKYVNKDGTTKSTAQFVGDQILTGLSDVEKALSQVASFIGDLHIPLISQIASGASVAYQAIGDEADVAKTAIDGGNVKQAQKNAGIDLAETAVGSLTEIPGAKQAVKGVVDVAGRAIKQGVKKAGESAVDGS